MKKELYPNLKKLKIPIHKYVPQDKLSFCYIKIIELNERLKKAKLSIKKFDELFGTQTCCDKGLYAWDVEAVLENMINKKLTGSQLNWD